VTKSKLHKYDLDRHKDRLTMMKIMRWSHRLRHACRLHAEEIEDEKDLFSQS
jgi:hypothetical protein